MKKSKKIVTKTKIKKNSSGGNGGSGYCYRTIKNPQLKEQWEI